MHESIRITAPCKINLHLRVLRRRADGFHDIESVFQLVSLADGLTVSVSGPEGASRVLSPLMELPAVNTVSRAIELFRAETGIRSGIAVDLEKRVPAGAGLGGGSSDAAATLVALDRLFRTDLSRAALDAMAAKIGSDVPFFLSGGAAIVEGRGERVTPIPARDDLYGVLIWPGVHSSTAEAYGLVDAWHASHGDLGADWPAVSELADRYHGPVGDWRFANSFTAPLEARYPAIRDARLALVASGAAFAEMSGSGSSVFGLFADRQAADNAYVSLSAHCKQCVKFLLLASSPMR
ncbi:MAG TPA: 4-(cytidine 5'-diphospho)-2-C-methyl-D-erythritol kinase [Treponemataceae bacterium]|nr:4-(cytidine 5'-diphospho)-2-C-methyl-D-erythritol kinase [Treponemataceae bacterium]HPS42878.1 4-(cytidine 5'-diphospho)-2-C-methyl-D-erythritol kinase [Treponemataceae bacterium]